MHKQHHVVIQDENIPSLGAVGSVLPRDGRRKLGRLPTQGGAASALEPNLLATVHGASATTTRWTNLDDAEPVRVSQVFPRDGDHLAVGSGQVDALEAGGSSRGGPGGDQTSIDGYVHGADSGIPLIHR